MKRNILKHSFRNRWKEISYPAFVFQIFGKLWIKFINKHAMFSHIFNQYFIHWNFILNEPIDNKVQIRHFIARKNYWLASQCIFLCCIFVYHLKQLICVLKICSIFLFSESASCVLCPTCYVVCDPKPLRKRILNESYTC